MHADADSLRRAGAGAHVEVGAGVSTASSSSASHTINSNVGQNIVIERVETVVENGRRVTKRISQQADGETHASIEETEVSGQTRKRSGVRYPSDEL